MGRRATLRHTPGILRLNRLALSLLLVVSVHGGTVLAAARQQNGTTPGGNTGALATSINPSPAGQPVSFTVTVTSSGNPVTAGTVTFKDGATSLASVAVNAAGQAVFTTSRSDSASLSRRRVPGVCLSAALRPIASRRTGVQCL